VGVTEKKKNVATKKTGVFSPEPPWNSQREKKEAQTQRDVGPKVLFTVKVKETGKQGSA